MKHMRVFKKFVLISFALATGFWLLVPSVFAQEIKLHCFKADECTASPYKGTPSAQWAPECKADAKASSEGRFYYCYAPPIKVCQPGTIDTNCAVKLQVSIGGKEISGLEGYISALYQYLIAISGILAGIMIVWAGVKWLMSAGNAEMISDAKHKIGGAIIGLILVVMSYVLLQTINPALVTLKLPDIKLSRRLDAMFGNSCTFQSNIQCGKLQKCADNTEACGGAAVGECIGQWCGPSEAQFKCVEAKAFVKDQPADDQTLNPSSVLPWTCTHPGFCKAKCTSRFYNLCNDACLIAGFSDKSCYWNWLINKCEDAAAEGDACTQNTQCASGKCNVNTHKCTPLGGEAGDDACDKNGDCASGVCNTGATPNECGPSKSGTDCDDDSDCLSGICNNEETVATCRDAKSLDACAECDTPAVCKSGICGNDGECAGLSGEDYSTDDDNDGEYCD